MYTTFQVSREREKAVTTSIQIEQSLKDLEKVSLHTSKSSCASVL